MKNLRVIYIRKKLLLTVTGIVISVSLILSLGILNLSTYTFNNSSIQTIVIDPGHGGIDGGTTKNGVLEKDINLDISIRLKTYLEQKGYLVILTRDTDKSLDGLQNNGSSRHLQDLKTRTKIINNSNAQLFLSIHVNYSSNSRTNGSIVIYNKRFSQSKILAYSVQRALNIVTADSYNRMIHDPISNSDLRLLDYSEIPGVLIETAFISNQRERELLQTEEFRSDIARSIMYGVEKYFKEIKDGSSQIH